MNPKSSDMHTPHPHKHTPSCLALGVSSCRRHGCSSFVCLLLLLILLPTHPPLRRCPEGASTPQVWRRGPCVLPLHCQTPVRCRLLLVPHGEAALPGCNWSVLAFSMKAEFFLIIQVLTAGLFFVFWGFFFSSKGAFLAKPTKNGNSSI